MGVYNIVFNPIGLHGYTFETHTPNLPKCRLSFGAIWSLRKWKLLKSFGGLFSL